MLKKFTNSYVGLIKDELRKDEYLKSDYKQHLISINEYLVSRYLKYDIIKEIYQDYETVIHEKMKVVKRISGFPPIMSHPVWNKPKLILKNIQQSYYGDELAEEQENEDSKALKRQESMFFQIDKLENTKNYENWWIDRSSISQKLKVFNYCLTSISRAFLLLAEDTDEVTADDLMQFTAFVFVLSEVKGLISSLEYLKAFTTSIIHENQGVSEYVITTASSCIEYIMNRF